MKNKKSIFILVPAVLFIWGTVVYKFFSYSNDEEVVQNTAVKVNLRPLSIKERDTFSIEVGYRDPFLGKTHDPNYPKISKKSKKVVKIMEPLPWPSVVYKGIVSDVKNKSKVFMLIIEGKTHLMKKGDSENGVLLKEGDRQSVHIIYRGNHNRIQIIE